MAVSFCLGCNAERRLYRAVTMRSRQDSPGARGRLWSDSIAASVSDCEIYAKPQRGDALKEIKREELRLGAAEGEIARGDAKQGIGTRRRK